ncbi:hypothetical protein BX667DRAFT_64982 [Coemansia mojavensis]|nr:hypothetical protein BX667DRAFT_64982 [Coemansia mojavensis]
MNRLEARTGVKLNHMVFLIDEFKISSLCPACHSGLENTVDNPCPYQRKKHPQVLCHGLLQCQLSTVWILIADAIGIGMLAGVLSFEVTALLDTSQSGLAVKSARISC